MNPVCIVIMAKAPLPGFAKTRLIPALGEKVTARLARWLLINAIQQAVDCKPARIELRVTPADADIWNALPIPDGIDITGQGEGDLGQRMEMAVHENCSKGNAVVLTGTDCPALDAPTLQALVEGLAMHDAVIIPALDGGFVALGLNHHHDKLFSHIAWSTSGVCQAMLSRLNALGLNVMQMAPLPDIDCGEDLIYLPGHLQQHMRQWRRE